MIEGYGHEVVLCVDTLDTCGARLDPLPDPLNPVAVCVVGPV